MNVLEQTPIDQERFIDAIKTLGLHEEVQYQEFATGISKAYGDSAKYILNGYSYGTLKAVKQGQRACHRTLPVGLVQALSEKGYDVSKDRIFDFFSSLGFHIQFECGCLEDNEAVDENDPAKKSFRLQGFTFEISEAKADAEYPEKPGFYIPLRIGFDQLRFSVLGEILAVDKDSIACKTPSTPEQAKNHTPAFEGWFTMKHVGTDPLCWILKPREEGDILENKIGVEKLLAQITTSGERPVAYFSAGREDLRVRITKKTEQETPSELIDEHRNKMMAAVTKNFLGRGAAEFVLYSKTL